MRTIIVRILSKPDVAFYLRVSPPSSGMIHSTEILIITIEVRERSYWFDVFENMAFALKFSSIFHVNEYPILFYFSCVESEFGIIPRDIKSINMEVHNVLKGSPLSLMQGTVELDQISML